MRAGILVLAVVLGATLVAAACGGNPLQGGKTYSDGSSSSSGPAVMGGTPAPHVNEQPVDQVQPYVGGWKGDGNTFYVYPDSTGDIVWDYGTTKTDDKHRFHCDLSSTDPNGPFCVGAAQVRYQVLPAAPDEAVRVPGLPASAQLKMTVQKVSYYKLNDDLSIGQAVDLKPLGSDPKAGDTFTLSLEPRVGGDPQHPDNLEAQMAGSQENETLGAQWTRGCFQPDPMLTVSCFAT